ncbi:VOC family protein [Terrabacter carboxydivorans]|uniref:Glyoxalase-like domain-containing protein n=1 Tax=Terrabacter carboxydivorans TaxID=619730 RepID=A0ABN3LXD0_9MICO
MTTVSWVTAFLDLPPHVHEAGTRFWSAVTAYAVSPARGDDAEFTTLLPPVGDPFLKIQRTTGDATARPGLHLDLHVGSASAERAQGLGAEVVHRSEHGYVVLRSPGGFVFCLVHEVLSERPWPTRWPQEHESIVDQVCLDIPPSRYETECSFWSALTGWPVRGSVSRPEFRHLVRPDGIPIRLLLQRLEAAGDGLVTGHLDLACDARPTEVSRHEALGATVVADHGGGWTTLRDPAGALYCVTERDPRSGLGR